MPSCSTAQKENLGILLGGLPLKHLRCRLFNLRHWCNHWCSSGLPRNLPALRRSPLTAAKMPSSEPSSRVIVSKAIPLSLMLSLGLDSRKVPEAQQRGDSSAPGALGTATDLAENEGFIPEVHSPSDSSSQMDVPLTTKQPWLSRGKANAAFTVALSTTRTGWPVNLAMHRIIGETSGTQQDPPPCGPGRTVRWNPSFGKWPD